MENLTPVILASSAVIAAGTAETWCWTQPMPGEWVLEAAYVVAWTTLALHASNYTTLAIKQGATTLGSLSSETVAFTAGTARAFTLSGGLLLQFGQGDVCTVTKAETGTGGALDFTITGYLRRIG